MKIFKTIPRQIDVLPDKELFHLRDWLTNEITWYEVANVEKADEYKERVTEVDEELRKRDQALFEDDMKNGRGW